MSNVRLIPVPVTGQTSLYPQQLQAWAQQNFSNRGIEAYCLDAPECGPSGVTIAVFGQRVFGDIWGQALSVRR